MIGTNDTHKAENAQFVWIWVSFDCFIGFLVWSPCEWSIMKWEREVSIFGLFPSTLTVTSINILLEQTAFEYGVVSRGILSALHGLETFSFVVYIPQDKSKLIDDSIDVNQCSTKVPLISVFEWCPYSRIAQLFSI